MKIREQCEMERITRIMKRLFRKGLCLTMIMASCSSSFSQGLVPDSQSSKRGSWFDKHQQGWHWYKRIPQIPKVQKLVQRPQEDDSTPRPKNTSPTGPETYAQKVKAFQEKLEEFQSRAVMNPTVENVIEYRKLHDAVIEQSNKFQEVWMYTALMNTPPQNVNFATPRGREIKEKQEQQTLERRIQGLAQNNGLFFVFKQSCPYCHEFAPVVKAFAQKYGFDVKAISADGGVLNEFPEAEQDNGVLSLINPDGIYPALYLVNPVENAVFPISWGMINEVGLKDNIKHYLGVTDKGSNNGIY